VKAVRCIIGVEPARVFDVLSDGWKYPLWVVGTTHMRDVDRGWPSVGARLHHSVGVWPLCVHDQTEVLAVVPRRMLVLRAHAWPGGSARIDIELEPVAGGSTLVSMCEQAATGPGRLVPEFVQYAALWARNNESLRRLRSIAERS
jgi:uncharacterized protein YndB with AHSA1/START domain